MSIVTYGYGPGGGGSFENDAVRFSDMKNAKVQLVSIDGGLKTLVHSAKIKTEIIGAGIKTEVLSANLITDEPKGTIKC